LITITTVIVMNLINNVAGEDVVMTNIFIFLISVLVLLISMLFMFYYFVMGLLKSGDEKQNQYGEPRQIIGHIYSR
jgi:flagellar basal body-associated protein FliL